MRTAQGGDRCLQRKEHCEKLVIEEAGVTGEQRATGLLSFLVGGRTRRVVDFNSYRSRGHVGRFDAGTNDRAVSVVMTASYEALRSSLGDDAATAVCDGDLGENVLIAGPTSYRAGDGGVGVGARLQVGSAVIELTEVRASSGTTYSNASAPATHAASRRAWSRRTGCYSARAILCLSSCACTHAR